MAFRPPPRRAGPRAPAALHPRPAPRPQARQHLPHLHPRRRRARSHRRPRSRPRPRAHSDFAKTGVGTPLYFSPDGCARSKRTTTNRTCGRSDASRTSSSPAIPPSPPTTKWRSRPRSSTHRLPPSPTTSARTSPSSTEGARQGSRQTPEHGGHPQPIPRSGEDRTRRDARGVGGGGARDAPRFRREGSRASRGAR